MTKLPPWSTNVLNEAVLAESELEAVTSAMRVKKLDQERLRFLSDFGSFDVSACPGSGKTTLVVAKILLLARNWESTTQGMLILSHTNVAKDEVSKRFQLLGTELPDGGRPHYIGTIHSFVNKYLSIPYLISQGITPKAIDDEIATSVRRQLVGGDWYVLKSFLDQRYLSFDAIKLTDSDLKRPFGPSLLGKASEGTRTYMAAANAVRQSVELGYLRHDEVFVFANRYLDEHPEIVKILRHKFPFIMLDEMQDTTTEQAKLLSRIFPYDDPAITVERIGDPNQAIFGGDNANDFPQPQNFSIANSYRFGTSIARLASPTAVYPVEPSGLLGLNDRYDGARNLFIIFHPDVIDKVLPSFADEVLQNLPKELLGDMKVSAVGARHSLPPNDGDNPDHFPKIVSHYLPTYTARSSTSAVNHATFSEYVVYSRRLVVESRVVSSGLEHVAEGLLRFINGGLPHGSRLPIKSNKYRQLLDLFDSAEADYLAFCACLAKVLSCGSSLGAAELNDVGVAAHTLAVQVCSSLGSDPDNYEFFEPLPSDPPSAEGSDSGRQPANCFVYKSEHGRELVVEVSSIHAVKGETHAATLLLDTYNRTRFIAKLLPWLNGKRSNVASNAKDSDKRRLHQCYVAMTRPAGFLAVAAAEQSLGKSEEGIVASIQKLEDHGWKILRLSR